jgi:hypothetical protein
MITSTVLLRGDLIVDSVKFTWWVIEAQPRCVTVSHPLHGTKTAAVDGDPAAIARRLGQELLPKRPGRPARGRAAS